MNPQQQILIVDDDSKNRQILTIMLTDDFVTKSDNTNRLNRSVLSRMRKTSQKTG